MTRKQAIFQAIQALSALEGQEEAITRLQELYEEMPLIHWSDKSIRDTVEQFIADNGRVPTASDFRKKGMPPHPVIKQKFKITLAEWLDKNYPTPEPDPTELRQKYTQEFIDEYIRIKPTSSKDFNQRRDPKTKTWMTVAKYHNIKTWRALLLKLSLPSFNSRERKQPIQFAIKVTSDVDYLNSKEKSNKIQV